MLNAAWLHHGILVEIEMFCLVLKITVSEFASLFLMKYEKFKVFTILLGPSSDFCWVQLLNLI